MCAGAQNRRMLWHQIAGHALLPPQMGVSAVVCQVLATTCLMLLSSKQGLKIHNYMIHWRSHQLIAKARKKLFLRFFFFLFFTIIYLC